MTKFPVLVLFVVTNNLTAQKIVQTPNGIKARIHSTEIEIKFYSAAIVRVVKWPAGQSLQKESLSVIKIPEKVSLRVEKSNQFYKMSSALVTVNLDVNSGKISFIGNKKQQLFAEKEDGLSITSFMDASDSSYKIKQAFVLDKTEAIYGLGQQQNGKLNQRGQQILLRQDNMKICIPFIQSIKGYGVFWDNYSPTQFADTDTAMSFESSGKCVDYYFLYGKNSDDVVNQMSNLTGKSPMLPLWAYGFFQSRERYKSQEETAGVVEKYRALKIPIDGIVQDWQYWGSDSNWNAMRFDNSKFNHPKEMIDKVHQLNAHVMISAWASFGPQTKQYADLKKGNMLLPFETWPRNADVTPYDPFNPAARDIYWKYLDEGIFSLGMDAWWLDSSEPDHFNITEKDFDLPTYLGTFRSVANAFPLMHVKGVYEHQRSNTSDKRVVILTRSAFAGQQRYAAICWSGDVVSSWETLRKQIPAGLNFSLCGIPYWNTDIGGFFSGRNFKEGIMDKTFHELYVRWMQFAVFTPMMRSHGTDTPREIYQFGNRGDWSFDAQEKAINLRYHLLPYLYSTAWNACENGVSFIRPLISQFASDTSVNNITSEFMFGNSFLVTPVTTPMYITKQNGKVVEDFSQVKTQNVYLPRESGWYDFWTNEKHKGGQTIVKPTSIDILPVYVKAGSILPWGPLVQYANEKKWDSLEIRIYLGADAVFTLYEDECDNYNYEKGFYSTIQFNWNDATESLIISDRTGKFSGMLQKRVFKIVFVSIKNRYHNKISNISKSIQYSGKSIVVKP